MANSILTPTQVTRKALMILHQKLNFVGSINRQYDDSFAKSGDKIGSTLKIRLPNEYSVRTGKAIDVQDTSEDSVTLTVATQKGVDTNFTSEDLTMNLDDFSERILDPAMSVLAANIEADTMSMYKDIYNEVSDVGATLTSTAVLQAGKKLTDSLAPRPRVLNLNTQDNVDLVEALKTLYNPQKDISDQFRDGLVGNNFVGFSKVFENTLWPIHTTGTDDGTGDYLTDVAAGEADGSDGELNVDTGAGSWKKGDIFYIADCYRVHPETKVSTGVLQKFVVTADATPGAGGGSLYISPNIITSGAKQNVTGFADGKALHKNESDDSTDIGASADYGISMAYHKDAFAFATADLIMPKGVDFSAREVLDGISMRIVRQYDINNDQLPCRIDVLYGYKTVRAALACRIGFH